MGNIYVTSGIVDTLLPQAASVRLAGITRAKACGAKLVGNFEEWQGNTVVADNYIFSQDCKAQPFSCWQPAAPVSFTAQLVGPLAIRLRWTMDLDPQHGQIFITYWTGALYPPDPWTGALMVEGDSGLFDGLYAVTPGGAGTMLVDEFIAGVPLLPATQYCFSAWALDRNGMYGLRATATATTP